MYKNFFGFKERPFKLVPDPAFLYLSRSHEVALAHLAYAISQGEGFVEITGEVGTGKTTLCRVFLDNLDENTEAALIFNPILDSVQLLKAINDEFGISSEADNLKDLIDTLNTFLLAKKAEDTTVILIIDEAQNLKHDVLEQLRLLSNLETNTSKLLQIILFGQPELGELLDSYELRQLGQRITLSSHIVPLNYKETCEYIRHRIQIASQKPGVKFTPWANRTIFKHSKGIPRLINIACDRALLTAYGMNRHIVTGNIARSSIRELANRGTFKRFSPFEGKNVALVLLIICIAAMGVVLFQPGNIEITATYKVPETQRAETFKVDTPPSNPIPKDSPDQIPIQPAAESAGTKSTSDTVKSSTELAATSDSGSSAMMSLTGLKTAAVPVSDPEAGKAIVKQLLEPQAVANATVDFEEWLRSMDSYASKTQAVRTVLDLWNHRAIFNPLLENMDNAFDFFRLTAKQNGFAVHRVEDNLNLIWKLNLPAILECYLPDDPAPRYLTLGKMDDQKITFSGPEEEDLFVTEVKELNSYWSGKAYILWKNFLSFDGTIPLDASYDSILTLKMLLQDIGLRDFEISPFYDDKTRAAVKKIQARHGLYTDGYVGPLTKIVLYNEKNSLQIPHIRP
jgi:general secretion pathway protein A